VRLAFGTEVDLDLHVTDPLQETIYFGNATSASGGLLVRDVGCRDPEPRVEEVRFTDPPPGRYRVGVDFFLRCQRVAGPVPFVLEVWADGVRHVRRGAVAFGSFEPLVLELDVGGFAQCRGRCTSKREPRPGSEATRISPPWLRTIW